MRRIPRLLLTRDAECRAQQSTADPQNSSVFLDDLLGGTVFDLGLELYPMRVGLSGGSARPQIHGAAFLTVAILELTGIFFE